MKPKPWAAFGKGQKEQAQDLFTHAYRAGRESRSTVALNNAVEVPEALFAAIVRSTLAYGSRGVNILDLQASIRLK